MSVICWPSAVREWGKFSILEPVGAEHQYESLSIIDPSGHVAFIVKAYPNDYGWDQEDLWWRATCLVSYFNVEPPEDNGGST